MLTKITETSYSGRNSSSTYSLVEDDIDGTSNSATAFAQSLLGDGCREVDLTANAVVSIDALSNVSTYSATSTVTRYTIGSDEIGNITSVGDFTLNWNGRKLESISQDGTTLVSYDYNMDGQRVSKTVLDTDTDKYITTEYFYSGSILAGQKKGNDVLIFMYDNNGDIFGFTYNGTPYYYVKNAQNDVWLIVDENNEPAVLYQYDAWGVVTACYDITEENISAVNPITYRSYYMDIELGFFMYYLNSRYYIADWGRFISADSYVQTGQGVLGNNMFVYCLNNPVNSFDDFGEFSLPNWAKVAIGVVGIAGLTVATVCTAGTTAVICGAALSGAIVGGTSSTVIGAIGGGVSGGLQGALDGACSGFMSGTLIGGVTGAASAGINIVTGATTVVGNAHGSILHKLAINMEAGKMAASGQYSQIGVNKSLKKMGLNGTKRPDVIGIAKNGINKLVEVVSPKQSTDYIVNKMSNMLSNNSGSTGKIVKWVRRLFK